MSQAPQEPPSGRPPSDAPTQRLPDGGSPPGGPPGSGGSRRNLWTGLGLGAGAVVLAVVLFVLLRPDDDDSEPTAATTPTVQTTTSVETTTEATTEVTTTTETTTEQVTTTAPADRPQRVRINVVDGQPEGGEQSYDVDKGADVVLVVTADVEDEVHLHGYDLAADVAPGHPARISFTADDVGQFEIELELSGVPIGELVVS